MKRIGERAVKDRRKLDWSRRLPRPLTIPTVMKLRTLADVRTLMSHLPVDRKRMDTWQLVAARLQDAASSGDIAELVAVLRVVFMIEHIECR